MRLSQYDEAVRLAEKSLSVTKGSDHHPSQRTALNTLGSSFIMMGYFEKAADSFKEALILVPEGSIGAGYVMGNLGLSQKNLGNYGIAKEYLKSAHTIFESKNQQNSIVWIKYLLGCLYIDNGEIDRSENILLEAIAASKSLELSHWLNSLRVVLAYTYLCQNRISDAFHLATETLLESQLKLKQSLQAESLAILGLIHLRRQEFIKALEMLKSSIIVSHKIHNIPLLLSTLITFLELYLQNQDNHKVHKLSYCLSAQENFNKMAHVDKIRLKTLVSQYDLLPKQNSSESHLTFQTLIEFLANDSLQSNETL